MLPPPKKKWVWSEYPGRSFISACQGADVNKIDAQHVHPMQLANSTCASVDNDRDNSPYHPCMVYLPTFGWIFVDYMWVNIASIVAVNSVLQLLLQFLSFESIQAGFLGFMLVQPPQPATTTTSHHRRSASLARVGCFRRGHVDELTTTAVQWAGRITGKSSSCGGRRCIFAG